ncbi:MAG: toll/interleukin-1 receptor domain-containing protein [Rubrivivax sp.]|nr:toll/interleukin-1 receptor domain-containing protein [Rubrivivax sp.]
MSDVFDGYASADRDRAQAVAAELQARGLSVWWDRAIPPGRQFDEVIEEALDAARCVALLWTEASAASTLGQDQRRRGPAPWCAGAGAAAVRRAHPAGVPPRAGGQPQPMVTGPGIAGVRPALRGRARHRHRQRACGLRRQLQRPVAPGRPWARGLFDPGAGSQRRLAHPGGAHTRGEPGFRATARRRQAVQA